MTEQKSLSKREQFQAEYDALVAKMKPLRDERDALMKQIAPTEAKIRELNAKIKEAEQPALAELEKLLRALK